MLKMSDFSCLGNLRLRCVRTVVSGTKPFSLNCFIRTTGFLNAFWRSFFGQNNDYNSPNGGRSQFWIAASPVPGSTQNMLLSVILLKCQK